MHGPQQVGRQGGLGFRAEVLIEDTHTSIDLFRQGWKSVYVNFPNVSDESCLSASTLTCNRILPGGRPPRLLVRPSPGYRLVPNALSNTSSTPLSQAPTTVWTARFLIEHQAQSVYLNTFSLLAETKNPVYAVHTISRKRMHPAEFQRDGRSRRFDMLH